MATSFPYWIEILQHLQRFNPDVYNVTGPFEATQPGIGGSVGISRAHVAVVLKILRTRMFVEERLLHVPGNNRRCKTYFPTTQGLSALREVQERCS